MNRLLLCFVIAVSSGHALLAAPVPFPFHPPPVGVYGQIREVLTPNQLNEFQAFSVASSPIPFGQSYIGTVSGTDSYAYELTLPGLNGQTEKKTGTLQLFATSSQNSNLGLVGAEPVPYRFAGNVESAVTGGYPGFASEDSIQALGVSSATSQFFTSVHLDGRYRLDLSGALSSSFLASSFVEVVSSTGFSYKESVSGTQNTPLQLSVDLNAGDYGFAVYANSGFAYQNYLNHSSAAEYEVNFTLTPNPKNFVLAVGVDYGNTLEGGYGAEQIGQAFGSFDNFSVDTLRLDYSLPDNGAKIVAAIDAAKQQVQPGDTFVFYFNGHTFENLLPRRLELSSGGIGFPDTISEGLLPSFFQGSEWEKVNKLFIMDTCFAEAYAEGNDGLAMLPNSWVISASKASKESYYGPQIGSGGVAHGWGLLGQALESFLANTTSLDQLTTTSFRLMGAKVRDAGAHFDGQQGFFQTDLDGILGVATAVEWDPVFTGVGDASFVQGASGAKTPDSSPFFVWLIVIAAMLLRRT